MDSVVVSPVKSKKKRVWGGQGNKRELEAGWDHVYGIKTTSSVQLIKSSDVGFRDVQGYGGTR